MRLSLPLQLLFKHVKGHQDTGSPTVLTWLAWMNINMDMQAKGKLLSPGSTQLVFSIPFKGWTCTIEGQRIIKNITTSLWQHLNSKIILNHWAMREQFTLQVSKMIDWEASGKAMNSLPLSQRQWVSKVAAKFLPDGKNMQRWGLRPQANCPRCSCLVKDKEHIFKCPLEAATKQWGKAIEELDHWLEAAKTHLQLQRDIIEGLTHWQDQIPGCQSNTKGSWQGNSRTA